jgi:hypothetical protein
MTRISLLLLSLILALAATPAASACPLCKEAIAISDDEEEVNNLPATYNQSIYLMLAAPYLSLAGVGWLIYRGCKKNEAYRAALAANEPFRQRPV